MHQTYQLYEDSCENWIIAVSYGDYSVFSILVPKDANIPLRTALNWLKSDSIPEHITSMGASETRAFTSTHQPIADMDEELWTFYQECEYAISAQ